MCGADIDVGFGSAALVLGGTRGLGLELSRELLAKNAQPIIVGRTANELARSLPPGDRLRHALFIDADLRDPGCVERIMSLVRRVGDVTRFYWVAGEYHRGPVAEQTPEKLASMVATHFTGPVSVLSAFHAHAKATGRRYNLAVVGSVFVHKPGKQHATLAAMKAAKANFCRVFCHELAKDLPDSHVLLVNPWAIKTEFFDGYPMDPKAMASFLDAKELAARIVDRESSLRDVPGDLDLPPIDGPDMLELTIDRSKSSPLGEELLGPQPVKF